NRTHSRPGSESHLQTETNTVRLTSQPRSTPLTPASSAPSRAWTPLAEVTSSGACKMRVINGLALSTFLLAIAGGTSLAQDKPADATLSLAVGAQYDTAHVYVAPADLDRFSDSLIATFGGTKSQ